jgi:hypothetical protein
VTGGIVAARPMTAAPSSGEGRVAIVVIMLVSANGLELVIE